MLFVITADSKEVKQEDVMGRGLLLWLLGIPIPAIILIWVLGGLHRLILPSGSSVVSAY